MDQSLISSIILTFGGYFLLDNIGEVNKDYSPGSKDTISSEKD